MAYEVIRLKRECEASQIPSGQKVKLSKDTQVKITQSLGGSYTVITDMGYMLRIEGQDGDALGKTSTPPIQTEVKGKKIPIETLVWDQLRTCFDPEIPVNIVELGLIYECKVSDILKGEGKEVSVKMTLTAPGCGMGDVLKSEAEGKINRIPGVRDTKIDLVWDPPWSREMMSDAAKLQLGLM